MPPLAVFSFFWRPRVVSYVILPSEKISLFRQTIGENPDRGEDLHPIFSCIIGKRPSSKTHPNLYLRGDTVPTYNYTLGKITIDCECEQCGKPFFYEQKFQTSISSRYMPRPRPEEIASAAKSLKEQAQKILETKGVNVRKCPHCKQWQSWMTEGRQAGLAANIGVAFGILAAVIAGLVTYSNLINGKNGVTTALLGALILAVIILLAVFVIMGRIAQPIVRKYYHPKITVSPERIKEPVLEWVELNSWTGH
jgi:Zn finger protein HypA/HybF involved in hydrogenase expression